MFFESLDPIERALPSLKMLIFDHFVLRQKVGEMLPSSVINISYAQYSEENICKDYN